MTYSNRPTARPTPMMTRRYTGYSMPSAISTVPDSASGHRHAERRRTPDEFHRLIEKDDDAEGRQHLIEMAAVVEMPEDQHLQQQSERQRCRQRQRQPQQKAAGHRGKGRRQIGADHVLDAMGEVDKVHHAEHQRQAGGDQEQDQSKLQSVEDLDQEEGEGHEARSLSHESRCLVARCSPWRSGRRSWKTPFPRFSVWYLPSARLATLVR